MKKPVGPVGRTIGGLEIVTLAFGAVGSVVAPKDPSTQDAVKFISVASTATAGDTGAIFADPILTTHLVFDADQAPKPPQRLPIYIKKKV
jgi:hypothetical protein